MMSLVQFETACRMVFRDASTDIDLLIELGPSNGCANLLMLGGVGGDWISTSG